MTLRIEPGPTDDDNRWPCCEHCHEPWSVRLTPFHHDEPCEACRKDPAMSSHPCCEHCDHIPPHRRDDHDEACPECRLPPRMTCGGCAGLGGHKRWCSAVVGATAHRYGSTADMLEDCGDTIGATMPGLANECYQMAEFLRLEAAASARRWKAGQP